MQLKKSFENGITTITLAGRIDSTSYHELEDALNSLDYTDLKLRLDFADVPYITSIGLRTLLVCRKRLSKETMILSNVTPMVQSILDTSGFTDFFTFESDTAIAEYTFTKLLASCVEKFGNEKKLFEGANSYSWQEIDQCSDIIAIDLAKQGVTKGTHVGICSTNSANWISCFLAIQKLNAIAIFVNFNLKPDEIISLSHIGDITHFCYGLLPGVTDMDAYLAAITGEDSVIRYTYNIHINVDFRTRIGETVDFPMSAQSDPDDLSLMIFTSGSTGKPKGAMYSSQNILTGGAEAMTLFRMKADDKICLFLPLFHVFGFVANFVLSMLGGASLYIPLNSRPDNVLSTIADNKCTIFHSVPTMFFMIVKSPSFSPDKVASLRCSYMGGAPITQQQMAELMKLFPNNHFGNVYGMSEKPLISLTDYEDTAEHITGTIGKPVSSAHVEIREFGTGRLCKTGEIGEITVRSDSALTSYYKLDISKQAIDADNWLPTGDLGYIGQDGYLRITGRCKELIIRGGENISPNEVAASILLMDCISDVKVMGAPDNVLGEKVVAAIIVKKGCIFDESAAREFLSTRLAKLKIPEKFLIFDSFPILGTGKVDGVTLKKSVLARLEANK